MQTHPGKTDSLRWGPVVGWLAAIGLAIAMGLYAKGPSLPKGVGPLFPRVPPPPPDLPTLLYVLGVGSPMWYVAIVALPVMLWGARRIDAERHGRIGVIVLSAAVVFLLIAATAVAGYFLTYNGAPGRPSAMAYMPVALRQTFLPWIALAGITAAVEARRRRVRSAVEGERLRAQVAEQRLIALTGQLQPHFLFNTLQGISTLIHRDPDAADEMLAKLSDLLRDLLRHRDTILVPLEDELRFARTYLEIAKLRFAERLEFDIDAPAEVSDALVPLFLLQPLLENALSHGIGTKAAGGRVVVMARRSGERLHLQVEDNGGGLSGNHAPVAGLGLSNTRERLQASFGADQSFSLDAGAEGGAVARIDIPFRKRSRPSEV